MALRLNVLFDMCNALLLLDNPLLRRLRFHARVASSSFVYQLFRLRFAISCDR
jgi:hypothetical protein